MRWERARAYGLGLALLACAGAIVAGLAYAALRATTPWG